MGNRLLVSRPPETATLSTPQLRTPFTDITAQIGHRDSDPKCFSFQLRWYDCCEAYGRELAKEKCKYLHQDFQECVRCWKQMARCSDMLEMRYHLWFKGLTGSGPKVALYGETPRYDGFVPNFLMDDQHHKGGH